MEGIDFTWLEEKIFCRNLTEEERESIPCLIQVHLFKAGEKVSIRTQGSEGCIYIIRSGTIKLAIELDDGTIHLTHLSAGAQIGDLAFIDDNATITMEIIEDVVAYSIYRASLANFFIFRKEIDLKALWPKARMIPSINHSNGISFDISATTAS